VFFLMVFGSRILVDYFKESTEVIDWPISLAMTQVLCLPCIALGIGLLLYSFPLMNNRHPVASD
jgi:prolipoprotein diacylglyceryltransferase